MTHILDLYTIAIFEIVGQRRLLGSKESGVIEVMPLAYMRGRTLDNSFIILDEAPLRVNK